MKQLSLLAFSLCAALVLPAQADHHMMQERAYGYELMSPQERTEYQERMRAARTEQERETLRLEHHEKMKARAKAQGKTLPEMPPAGRGPGMGPGSGMGPGPGK